MLFEISHYTTRPLTKNSISTPVHLFVSKYNTHTLNVKKTYATARLKQEYNVLLASSNELISKYMQMQCDCDLEVQPLTVAKHISEVMGMPLVVVEKMYCNLEHKSPEWELHYFQPNYAVRDVIARRLLT